MQACDYGSTEDGEKLLYSEMTLKIRANGISQIRSEAWKKAKVQ